MTTTDEFLPAILANPADDLPRRVYADWLEEHGECERAEFIHVQIELARTKCEPPCPGNVHAAGGFGTRCACYRAALRRREQKLEKQYGGEWSQPIQVLLANIHDNVDWKFRRGFIAEIHCTLAEWWGGKCRHGRIPGVGPDIVRAAPIEVVRMTDREPASQAYPYTWAGLANCPERPAYSHWLPLSLVAAMKGFVRFANQDRLGQGYAEFDSPAAARAELSRVLLAEAKENEAR